MPLRVVRRTAVKALRAVRTVGLRVGWAVLAEDLQQPRLRLLAGRGDRVSERDHGCLDRASGVSGAHCASAQERRLYTPSRMRRRTTATTPRPTASRVTTPANKSASTTKGAPPSRSP